MSKVISATVVNPNGKEDTCAYAVVDSKELYYLLSPVATLDNYTISFFIKAHANETLKIWYGEEYKEFEVTTSWQKVTWNFTAEWIDNLMLQFTEGNYYIYNTMLERGNVATDYSPSQYDQEKMLKDIEDALNTKYAQISITLDNIALEVNETSSKLGNVESSVKLMSDEINLKVNKNGVIGAINLSSEQAQIKASKIDLVGAVTISSLSSDVTAKFDTLDSITVTDNNLTYIDGAKIYTGSITADKIDVDDLFAQEITATGTITGATLVSYSEDSTQKVVIKDGMVELYSLDTRGEGGYRQTGAIYPAGVAQTGASGLWIFDGVETISGNDLDTVASQIPKVKTIKYSLQSISWTKSGYGMYYTYLDVTDMNILMVARGNWNGMKDTDLVQVGKLSSTRIVISANCNNFDVNSAIEVVFLYT